jgi:hypothetical protein
MFRKHPPFRPGRPLNRGIAGRRHARPVPPKLIEANKYLQEKEYTRAGELFEEVADNALKNGLLQAPILFIRAGECFLKS